MPTMQTLERFIAQVEANDHVGACEVFYAPHASMRENMNPPRVGRDAHVEAERKVMARAAAVHSRCVRPVFVNGDQVVVRWVFRFDWRDGSTTEMEELACQRWQGEQIVEEQFFYDPAQRIAQRRAPEGGVKPQARDTAVAGGPGTGP